MACSLIFPESQGVEAPVRKFIKEALTGEFTVAIFCTGTAILTVLETAQQLGKYRALREALIRLTAIARGPKSKGTLKRNNLTPNFLTGMPTTKGLVKRIEQLDGRGKRVAVALTADQPSTALAEAVCRGGGEICQFAPYHYRLSQRI